MSSKYLQDVEARRPKFIHVYPNGDEYARATLIILRPVEQKDLDLIIKAIEEKVRLPRNRPIRKIFEMSGILVTSCIQIEDGKYYVAASSENYFQLPYGQGIGWVRVGPVRTSKYANVHYVSRSEEEGTSKSLNSSNNMLASSKDTKERATKAKSPLRKTPASIKKNSRHKSSPQKIMATSELMENLSINNEEKKDSTEGYEVKSLEDTTDNQYRRESLNNIEDKTALKNMEVRNDDLSYGNELKNNDNVENVKEINNGHFLEESEPNDNNNKIIDEVKENVEVEKSQEELMKNPEEKKEEEERNENQNSNIKEDPENNKNEINFNEKDENNQKKYEITEENETYNGNEVTTEEKVNGNDAEQEILDEAATKIQATFRGHRVRSDMEKVKENVDSQDEVNNNTDVKEGIPSQIEES